jgi:hypothetical protein
MEGEGEGEGGNLVLASLPLEVLPTIETQHRQDCLVLFTHMQNLHTQTEEEESRRRREGEEQRLAILPWPLSLYVIAKGCPSFFPSVRVAWSWMSGGVLVSYSQAVYSLETGSGLPTRDMPLRERLGLRRESVNVTVSVTVREKRREWKRELKRAYYHRSLRWHPDRWASFPTTYQRRAQEVFELVGEAYRGLMVEMKGEPA